MRHPRVASLSCLLFFCVATNVHAQWSVQENVVFERGVDSLANGEVRIPSIVRASNGHLLAFAERRLPRAPGLNMDRGDVDLIVKRSDDEGSHWGNATTLDGANDLVFEGIPYDRHNTYHNLVPVVDPETGTIHVLYVLSRADDQAVPPGGELITRDRIIMRTSTDHGVTWSGRVDLTHLIPDDRDNKDYGIILGPGHGVTVNLGTPTQPNWQMVIPFRYLSTLGGSAKRIGFFYRSAGASGDWQTSNHFFQGQSPQNTDEIAISTIGGVNLYFNVRDQNADGDYRLTAILNNEGKGPAWWAESHVWTNAFVSDSRLPDPRCHASVNRISPTQMIFSNPATKNERRFLTIRHTQQEGAGFALWSENKLLTDRRSAYSELVRLPGNQNGVLFENGTSDAYERISFVRFSDDWVLRPLLANWSFDGLPNHIAENENFPNYESLALNPRVVGRVKVWSGNVGFGGTSWALPGDPDGIAPGKLVIEEADTNNRLDFGEGETFKIEARFRTYAHQSGGPGGAGAIIAKDSGTPAVPEWWLRVRDGQVQFFVNDGALERSIISAIPGGVSDNEWHSIEATRDGSAGELILKVDGTTYRSADGTKNLGNSMNVTIGNFNVSPRQFRGDIDYIRLSFIE